MDCLGKCRQDAIKYVSGAIIQKKQVLRREETGQSASQSSSNSEKVNTSRRNFFTVSALLATSAVMKAQEKKVDGGLAPLIDKKNPKRATSIVPARREVFVILHSIVRLVSFVCRCALIRYCVHRVI